MPTRHSSYVTFIKDHPVHNLPTSMTGDLQQHVQGLVHLLQIRVSSLPIIEEWSVDGVWIFMVFIILMLIAL